MSMLYLNYYLVRSKEKNKSVYHIEIQFKISFQRKFISGVVTLSYAGVNVILDFIQFAVKFKFNLL